MSTRLTMKAAAELLGVHVKTLEKYVKDPDFAGATGYHRNPLNGRATFDENFFRIYAANVTGNGDLRAADRAEPGVIDAEVVTGSELEPVQHKAAIERVSTNSGSDLSAAIAAAFILPHKLLYTLKEAQTLTGLSRETLRPFCMKVAGKWKILPGRLSIVVGKIMDDAARPKRGKKEVR